jgi:thymidylate kinase
MFCTCTKNIIENNDRNVLITERSQYESKAVFAQTLNMTTEENIVYNEYYKLISTKPDYFVYIRTPPCICLSRIKSRERIEESDISLNYLEKLDYFYEKNFENAIVIDGTLSTDEVCSQVYEKINNLIN